jgi:hypothetical protein
VALHLHLAFALEQNVDLLRAGVVVALGDLPGLEARLGEALVRGPAGLGVEEDADRAPVLRREGGGLGAGPDVHAPSLSSR